MVKLRDLFNTRLSFLEVFSALTREKVHMLVILPLAAALLLPKPSSPHAHLSSRRSVLGGAAAASALALLPTPPAFAASSGVFQPAAGSLEGTTIFITGANTGLGLESAKRLAAAGGSVVVSARSKAKAEEAAKEVGGKTIGIELDLADLSSVKSLPARLEAALGGPPTIDVLLNNAGVMAVPCPRLDLVRGNHVVRVHHVDEL